MRGNRSPWLILIGVVVIAGLILAACGGDAGQEDRERGSSGAGLAVPTETPEPPLPTGALSAEQSADLAPPFGSIDAWYNGDAVSLDQLRGQPVLLVFWADF